MSRLCSTIVLPAIDLSALIFTSNIVIVLGDGMLSPAAWWNMPLGFTSIGYLILADEARDERYDIYFNCDYRTYRIVTRDVII